LGLAGEGAGFRPIDRPKNLTSDGPAPWVRTMLAMWRAAGLALALPHSVQKNVAT